MNYLTACLAIRLADLTGKSKYREASAAFYRAARAAGRGTSWLSFLGAPAEQADIPAPPSLDPLDENAMTGVIDELNRIGRPATFDNEMIRLEGAP